MNEKEAIKDTVSKILHGKNSNDVVHAGVKGMKWGVRKDRKTGGKKSAKEKRSLDSARARKLKRKKLSSLTNDELSELNRRLQLERTYKSLNAKKTSKGKAFVAKTVTRFTDKTTGKLVDAAAKEAASVIVNGIKVAAKKKQKP